MKVKIPSFTFPSIFRKLCRNNVFLLLLMILFITCLFQFLTLLREGMSDASANPVPVQAEVSPPFSGGPPNPYAHINSAKAPRIQRPGIQGQSVPFVD